MEQNSPIARTSISGLLLIQRPTISDDRGFFREPVRIKEIEEAAGISFPVAQMNHARSSKNTLRGIHIAPWNKLVYVTKGKVQAVIADLRENSGTFGKYESFIIGDENRASIFVPSGFGNSYVVLSDDADYVYLTDQEWAPDKEFGVIWNDPDLNIKWEFEGEPVLSEKDQQNPTLKEIFPK
ncbi:MAG: dTDP-4-dehydrorhamnose 3,5-epimerase family protein [Candidatus Levybacteria bacterium]|nr:dTDP-4-dehydrorhamnose 3,5-epimerase family protein [Candidatus Levybacteria bacterium]